MKKIVNKVSQLMMLALPVVGMTACSDAYMEEINTDTTKPTTANPNNQLTTSLLQTYGDFGMMDTQRCYISGFTQHYAGGWNVSNYAGSVYAEDAPVRAMWSSLYSVNLKNNVDAINSSAKKGMTNLNAVLRIHRAYLAAVITDTYGDAPIKEAGMGFAEGNSTPKYDTQEEIYNFIFDELDACIAQLGTGTDRITGDVSAFNGDVDKWKKYANSLRLRYAMRISDVNPEKAQQEFEKACNDPVGLMTKTEDDAYIKYIDGPFTLYDGASKLDFRVNALGEMLYGQDKSSPTLLCATFYEMMVENQDPRTYRIARFYNLAKRGDSKVDEVNTVDVTDEVLAYIADKPIDETVDGKTQRYSYACVPGAAWYSAPVVNKGASCAYMSKWIEISDDDIQKYIPRLWQMIQDDPDAGYNKTNCQNRMLRPALSYKLLKGNAPGFLMSNAEVYFLLAEAKLKGWNLGSYDQEASQLFSTGITQAMVQLNTYYDLGSDKIADSEISAYVAAHPLSSDAEKAKEQINTESWLLNFLNPNEAWANMRRSDYPVIIDRTRYDVSTDFQKHDTDLSTPVRLKYPDSEREYNSANFKEAINRAPLNGSNDWHKRVWWDVNENTHLK